MNTKYINSKQKMLGATINTKIRAAIKLHTHCMIWNKMGMRGCTPSIINQKHRVALHLKLNEASGPKKIAWCTQLL